MTVDWSEVFWLYLALAAYVCAWSRVFKRIFK